ncbi:MAG: hypothetical protein CL531_00075 [Aestuariibacter sp.]|nr:hypothetical protein [Aestuariibacter sp.]MCP4256085.1 hypothetical protein [Planctomycetota bacterium]|tara:strand:- start:21198 stop:21899 length:702 start_codon:yes stop_codon:yes gene_type:complete
MSDSVQINDSVDLGWKAAQVDLSPALAETILSEDFQNSLDNMLKDFENLTPTYIESYGRNYISLADRMQLLEKHFPFGKLWFRYDFINRDTGEPVCQASLLVLTSEGYKVWLTRLGMGNSQDPSTDGVAADAETSARRRLLAAIGMGSEGDVETQENGRSQMVSKLSSCQADTGMDVKSLFKSYTTNYVSKNLPAISVDTEKLKFEDGMPPWEKFTDNDLKNLLKYVSMINSK